MMNLSKEMRNLGVLTWALARRAPVYVVCKNETIRFEFIHTVSKATRSGPNTYSIGGLIDGVPKSKRVYMPCADVRYAPSKATLLKKAGSIV
jgi:hypothetical protein